MIGKMIAAEAETWIGTPFKWQGRVKAGCDCKGLVAGVAAACGRSEGESLQAIAGDYSTKVDSKRLIDGLAQLFDKVTDIMPGDVLAISIEGRPQHLAIAAPTDKRQSRTIQAFHTGPRKVVAIGQPRAAIHSIWRWRD